MEIEQTTAAASGISRGTTIALYLAIATVYADMYLTQPILPLLSREFEVAPAIAGLTISAVVVMVAFASFAYGPISDALGRRPVLVWSCALLALPTLLCAFAPSFEGLLLFRALQGALIPSVTAVVVAYVGELYPPDEMGPVIGGIVSASVAGGLLGRVAGGLIADFFHWRAAFGIFAGITLCGAVLMAFTLPESAAGRTPGWKRAYQDMFHHFRNRRLVGIYLIGGTLFFAFLGLFTYLPYYLTEEPFQLSTSLVSLVYVVYLAGVLVAPLVGRLSTRVSRRTVMAVGLLIAMGGVLGTLSSALITIILSLIVLCIGMWTTQSVAPAFVTMVAGKGRGSANSLYMTFYYVGATLGSVLPGLAWQSWRWTGVVSACLISLFLALLSNVILCGDELRR